MRIPPGVTERNFANAVRQFEQIVGKEWVFTSDDDLNLYRDAYSPLFGEPEERIASGAVAPDRVEQVQEVVKVANQFKIPIYPVSTGRNLGYGGAAPNYSGSVVLDLKRMNRILDVSERNASCLVEPGVSYFDLVRHIEEKGYKLLVDVPDPGWGSPIGNALDHGAGYTMALYRNHFDAHCGMEVVLANGDLVRTGMGALPGAQTWQQFKFGVGPWIDGIFSQSNFGVVTKMGFWLMPMPDAYLSGTVLVSKRDDLIPLDGHADVHRKCRRRQRHAESRALPRRRMELLDGVLRSGEGHRRTVGIREREVHRGDSGRDLPGRRALPLPAHGRAEAARPQAAVRYSQPGDVLDWRAVGHESDAEQRPHVVLADHSANR